MALVRSWLASRRVSRLVLAVNPFGLTDSDLLELFGSPDTGPDEIGMAALKLREDVLCAVLTAKDNFRCIRGSARHSSGGNRLLRRDSP